MSIRKIDGSKSPQPTPPSNDLQEKVENQFRKPNLSEASPLSSSSSRKAKNNKNTDKPPSVLHAVARRSASISSAGKGEKVTPLLEAEPSFLKTYEQDISILADIVDRGKLTRNENRNQSQIADKIRSLSDEAAKYLNANPGSKDKESIEAIVKWSNFEVGPLLNEPVWNKTYSMPKLVQNLLKEDLGWARANKRANPELKYDETEKLKRKVLKAELALSVGGQVTKNTGATGTVIVTDVNGKSLGVHKVSSKNVSLRVRIKNAIKQYFGGQLYYLPHKPMSQPQSERATYLLDKHLLHFNMAPPTREATFNGKKGYFQQYVSSKNLNYVLAKTRTDFRAIPPQHIKPRAAEVFQRFAVMDFLIGNLDRHEENWFIAFDSKDNLVDIKAIDNANAFPEKHPAQGSTAARNQYKWKEFGISQVPFSNDFKEELLVSLNDENLIDILDKINWEMPDFLSQKSGDLLMQRAKVIRTVLMLPNASPSMLAQYSDDKRMMALLKEADAEF